MTDRLPILRAALVRYCVGRDPYTTDGYLTLDDVHTPAELDAAAAGLAVLPITSEAPAIRAALDTAFGFPGRGTSEAAAESTLRDEIAEEFEAEHFQPETERPRQTHDATGSHDVPRACDYCGPGAPGWVYEARVVHDLTEPGKELCPRCHPEGVAHA